MDFNNAKTGDVIELEQRGVIIRIPSGSVFIKLEATVIDNNGNVRLVGRNLTLDDIQDAKEYFDEYVADDDYDDKYALTDLGKKYAESLGD